MRALFDERSTALGLEVTSYTKPAEREDLFGDITDRRALFAIYGDETGTFSQAEKNIAYGKMWELKNDVEFGPTRTRAPGDHFGPVKGTISFLNDASPEEKATFSWVEQRAVAQISYDTISITHTDPSSLGYEGSALTGDSKIDSLIQRLVAEGEANYYRPIEEGMDLRETKGATW